MSEQKTKKSSSNRRLWSLALLFVLMSCIAIIFMFRERIIIATANHFSKNYGIKVEQLTDLTMQLDLQQPFFIDNISLEDLVISVDYLQLEQVTQNQAVKANSKSSTPIIPELPNWIPDLHIQNITLQADNLPHLEGETLPFWSLLDLNVLQVRNISYRNTDSYAEFGFSVWQLEQKLLTTQLTYELDSSVDVKDGKRLEARLSTDLGSVSSIVNRIFPAFNRVLSGSLQAKLALDPKKADYIDLTVLVADASLNYEQEQLISNAQLSLKTALILDDKGWQPEQVDLNLLALDPIRVSEGNCSQFMTLFKVDGKLCESFKQNKSAKISAVELSPLLPLSLQVKIKDRDLNRWKIKAEPFSASVLMSDNKLTAQIHSLQLTPDHWQGSWALSALANSRYFSDLNVLDPTAIKLTAEGQASIKPAGESFKAALVLTSANIAVNRVNLTDILSDDIRVNLISPTTVKIEDNKVLPFAATFSTASVNNQYQKNYEINALTALHKLTFKGHVATLNSEWQLDEATLESRNTIHVLNGALNQAEGYWLAEKQVIPTFMTHQLPLPKGLDLPAFVTNRLDYNLSFNAELPYLKATVEGTLTADSSHFNDISATDISTDWNCKVLASDTELIPSLNAKCQINSQVSSVNMGPVVNNIGLSSLVSFVDEKLQIVIDNASAEIFSGSVSVSPLLITDFDHIVGQLHIRNLSLPEALELYQVPGVKVTGLLKSDLPFLVQNGELSITDGTIEQQGEGGIIQIKGNATIDQLKLTQPQLRYALELLENLHYDRLHSDVNFQPSGETKLIINIKGRNPSVERPIEFNYSHEENILQLFRSLRINDSMYDALDKMNNP